MVLANSCGCDGARCRVPTDIFHLSNPCARDDFPNLSSKMASLVSLWGSGLRDWMSAVSGDPTFRRVGGILELRGGYGCRKSSVESSAFRVKWCDAFECHAEHALVRSGSGSDASLRSFSPNFPVERSPFVGGLLSCGGVLTLTTFYLCTNPGYLLGALPGAYLVISRISKEAGGHFENKLRVLLVSSTVFGAGLYFALAPVVPPKSSVTAAWNGILLQYGWTAARKSIFHTTSEWLLIYGFGEVVPTSRIEEIRRQGRDRARPVP